VIQFATSLTIAGSIGGLGYYGMWQMSDKVTTIYEDRTVPLKQLSIVSDAYAVNIVDTSHKVRSGAVDWASARNGVAQALAAIDKQWSAYLATKLTPEEERLVARVKNSKALTDAKVSELRTILANEDTPALDAFVQTQLYPAVEPTTEVISKLMSYQLVAAQGVREEAATLFGSLKALIIAFGIGITALGIAVVTFVAFSIRRKLNAAVTFAEQVATGDLNAQANAKGNDEINQLIDSLNAMAEKLREVVGNVSGVATSVASSSQELSASAEQLSQGSTEQAASSEEASASMEEIAANIRQTAENAATTEQMAAQSAKDAEASGQAVGKAVEAMQVIAAKINIVQEIARQTDLLALNAAVEAARAGEHGRGFAVVASEVRKLAERSQAAATEINALSGETLRTAAEAAQMLARLVPDIRKTAELVEEITAACREQDVGATQINQAIQQLDKVTQQNASASEEVSTASERLSGEAERLQQAIAFFRLDEAPAATGDQNVAIDKAVTALRNQGKAMAATQQQSVLKHPVPKGGFAFDIHNAGDKQDSAFRRRG
jgi:methyl-accepting chemotaxis protein